MDLAEVEESLFAASDAKLHGEMCRLLSGVVCKVLGIFPVLEASRPRSKSGIQALCSLHIALEKAKGLLQHCSESSKLYLAKPILESGDIQGILDPDLIGNFNEVQMRKMVLAVTLCLTRAARLRPQMKQILNLLQGWKDVEMWVNSDAYNAEEDSQDVDEAYPEYSVESHLGVSLLDVEDENTSFSSIEQNNHHSLEDSYLKGRWSRSSSFN